MPIKFFLSFFALLLFLAIPFAHAEEPVKVEADAAAEVADEADAAAEVADDVASEEAEQIVEEDTPSVMTLDIEGMGPYTSPADGSLGNDLWRDTPRAVVTNLLQVLPSSSSSPAMQKMIFGVLLSQADLGMMKDQVAPAEGQDLLTLRLEKLIAAGAYRRALDIYSSLSLENPPQSVAKAGVMAMLFSGEKSLACLELNTVQSRFKDNEFFKVIAAYCDATLSATPSEQSLEILKNAPDKILHTIATQKDFNVTYDTAAFAKYTQLEKAGLVADKRLRLPLTGGRNFSKLPASDVQIVSQLEGLSDKEKFVLQVRAVAWGLLNDDEFKKSVLSTIDLDIRKDPALAVPAGAEDWQQLPYLLQIATNKKDDKEKWNSIRAALPMAKTYGLAALRPFGELIYKTSPESPTFAEIRTAAEVMVSAGYPVTGGWAEIIEKYTPAEAEKQSYAQLLATVILDKNSRQDAENIKKFNSLLTPENENNLSSAKYIIENVDKGEDTEHNAIEIYDNALDLTFQRDYVMPSMEVWNRLQNTPKEGHIGETVLLITTALRGIQPENIYPALLQDVLTSLKRVGLTDISEDLANEAVLGNGD